MDEGIKFSHWGTILSKHGSMEGGVRETAVKSKQVIGALERVKKSVSIEGKKGIRSSTTLPTVIYIKDKGLEHSIALVAVHCGNELQKSCIWYDKAKRRK